MEESRDGGDFLGGPVFSLAGCIWLPDYASRRNEAIGAASAFAAATSVWMSAPAVSADGAVAAWGKEVFSASRRSSSRCRLISSGVSACFFSANVSLLAVREGQTYQYTARPTFCSVPKAGPMPRPAAICPKARIPINEDPRGHPMNVGEGYVAQIRGEQIATGSS
jgi:hypothetical protein